MRKLSKLSLPQEILDDIDAWTANYMLLESTGQDIPLTLSNKYKDDRIKDYLIRETFGKCAYCESKFSHTSYEEVEHIIPKSVDSSRRFDYQNLTLACSRCNNTKLNFLDQVYSIINPYSQMPEAYIFPAGAIMMQKVGKSEGFASIRALGLNRSGLVEKRAEKLKYIELLVDKWSSMPDGDAKSLLRAEIENEALASREYSLTVRYYLKSIGFI